MCVYQYIWRFPFYPMSKWNQTGDMISNPYNSFHWKKVANHVSHRSYYRIPNKSIPSKKTTKCVMFVLHLFMVNTLNYPIFSALYIPVISQKIALKQQCVLVKSQWTPLNRNETLWNHTSLFPPHVFTALTPCFTTAGFHGGWISWLLAGWCHVRKAGQRAVANVPTNSKRDDVWLRRSFWIDCFMFVMVNHMDV